MAQIGNNTMTSAINNAIPTAGTLVDATEIRNNFVTAKAEISALQAAIIGKNCLINGNFNINQRAVSGTVTLAAGIYGHDRWKAGASGCTYTFAVSAGITTLTITAGSLLQIIDGSNLPLGTNTCALSWTGTAQGRFGSGSYAATGTTASVVAGTNLSIEFNAGTLSLVQLEKGAVVTPFEQRMRSHELALCLFYYEQITTLSNAQSVASGFVASTTTAFLNLVYSGKASSPTITVDANFAILTGGSATVAYTSTAITHKGLSSAQIIVTGTFAAGNVGNGCLLRGDGTSGRIITISAEL